MRVAVWAAGAVLFLASCGGAQTPSDTGASLPGRLSIESRYAPRYSPPPSPRGVAPVFVSVPGGTVCNDPRLIGSRIGAIKGTHPKCGIAEPVSITGVAGVKLSRRVRLNCTAAVALADWVEGSAKPNAQRILSTSLIEMRPAAGYACRTRNSRKGARISEHGKGNAVDVSSFTFANGKTLTVEKDWRISGARQSYMRSLWKDACGTFGTVLGPESDRYHQDHFHFDVARHIGGSYCR